MDRLLRLTRVWNHLPGFRVAAETEHLPSAAERLGVTPSALSRTIAAVEKQLGRKLFHRRGRKLALNDQGRTVLLHLREAMRRLDDVLEALESEALHGPLRVVSSSQLATTLVAQAVPRLLEREPGLVPEVTIALSDPSRALLRGDVDVHLSEVAGAVPGLKADLLGEFSNGVYCGRGHPLYRRREPVTLDELLRHPFVTPPHLDGRPALDNWPPHLERETAVRVAQMVTALMICAQGRLLAALPDRVVETLAIGRGRLRRLDWDGMPGARVYVVRRRGGGPRDRALRLLEALRDEVAAG